MNVPVIWIGNPKQDNFSDWWDMALTRDVLTNEMWRPVDAYEFNHYDGLDGLAAALGFGATGAVVVIPARHWVEAEEEDRLKEQLDKLAWRVLFIIGDEECRFNYRQYKNDRTKIWLMAPLLTDDADFYIGSGYAPRARELLAQKHAEYTLKPLDWFYAGQNNHHRRQLASDIMTTMGQRTDMSGRTIPTAGFTQGMSPDDYFTSMAMAKAAPAPSGVQIPDSFRVYEALEAGAVPIADDVSTVLIHAPGYWVKTFGEEVPFKVFDDYANLEGYICDVKVAYPVLNNRVFAWWQAYKRQMVYTLHDHIREVSEKPLYMIESDGYTTSTQYLHTLKSPVHMYLADKITVIIPTSPIKSHPSTRIIEQTISSIRHHLPDSEIIITFDGVRNEQDHYRKPYEEYIKEMLWKCNFEYKNVLPLIFDRHSLQVQMARTALKYVKTPTLLYVEHDCTIRADAPIDWNGIVACIEDGNANMIRLSHESQVLDVHRHLYIDPDQPEMVNGVPLIRTFQYSQRPHVASVAFYRRILTDYFSEDATSMIEDRMHGVVDETRQDGLMGWNQHRIFLYAPDGDHKRSYTTDGRDGDPKYDDTYIF